MKPVREVVCPECGHCEGDHKRVTWTPCFGLPDCKCEHPFPVKARCPQCGHGNESVYADMCVTLCIPEGDRPDWWWPCNCTMEFHEGVNNVEDYPVS